MGLPVRGSWWHVVPRRYLSVLKSNCLKYAMYVRLQVNAKGIRSGTSSAAIGLLLFLTAIAVTEYADAAIRAAAVQFPHSIQPPHMLLFVASMDYHANIDGILWFVTTAWPALQQRFAESQTGNRSAAIPRPDSGPFQGPDIIVTGTVPDVRPYYADASAVLVPLRTGSGTRLKILEAMAAGVPVISTPLGAEGIDVNPGKDILLTATPEQFIESIERILKTPELSQSIAAAARQLMQERYDWPMIGERLFAIHADLVGRKRDLRRDA